MKQRRMLFVSFGGRQYSDSPRALYEAMRSDPFFQNWEMAWAFTNPADHRDMDCPILQIDSKAYFEFALSSKVWITNTSIGRGLQFKKDETICLNTWHGCPIKKMGYSLDPNPRYKEQVDIGCYQNELDKSVFSRLFNADSGSFLPVDLPRNDRLALTSSDERACIRDRLGIPDGKRVILYMPTYRDYNLDEAFGNYFFPPIDLARWERELGDDYVVLVRFHYLIDKGMSIPNSPSIINVTDYADLNDLYIATDILISDYSSSFIDFSILKRPMLCFAYDYDEYAGWRGFEIDLESEMPCRIDRSEDALLESIKEMDYSQAVERATRFHEKYSRYAGRATPSLVEELKRRLR